MRVGLVLAFIAASSVVVPAVAQTETVLYSFKGGTDGANPGAPPFVTRNLRSGKLIFIGTTTNGGNQACNGGAGCGTIFRVTQSGQETVLHTFTGGADGGGPVGGLLNVHDLGNLAGTANYGGANGDGTIYEIAYKKPGAPLTVLYNFKGTPDGAFPQGALTLPFIRQRPTVVYSTTQKGGASNTGTVFSFQFGGTADTVLYSFTNGADGGLPYAGVLDGGDHKLYGTTTYGGANGCHAYCGTAFAVAADGSSETTLHDFGQNGDGAGPIGGLKFHNFHYYGTTYTGGANSRGTIYRITFAGAETVLYSFTDGADGAGPVGNLVIDGKGNIYGTASYGGAGSCNNGGVAGCGTVFKLDKTDKFSVVYTFQGGTDGATPAGLAFDTKSKSLFGTTSFGGSAGFGTVFQLTP